MNVRECVTVRQSERALVTAREKECTSCSPSPSPNTRCTHVVSLLTYSARATTFYHTHTHIKGALSQHTHTHQHEERDTNTSTLSYGNWMSTSALRLFCFFSALRFVSFWFCFGFFVVFFHLVFFFAPPFVILFILMSNATAHANWHCPKYANWIIKANQRDTQRARERL